MNYFEVPQINKKITVDKLKMPVAHDMPSMHSHQCHELYFLLSGERRYFIGHTIYDVLPGNIVIIPKSELHRTTALNTKGYNRYVIYFYDDCADD